MEGKLNITVNPVGVLVLGLIIAFLVLAVVLGIRNMGNDGPLPATAARVEKLARQVESVEQEIADLEGQIVSVEKLCGRCVTECGGVE